MKKTLISFNILLLTLFFTIIPSYGEEDFFIDGNFTTPEKASSVPVNVSNKIEKIKQKAKDVKNNSGFFSKFKKEKQPKDDGTQKGYYGTLPNIYRDFRYKQQTPKPPKEEYKVPTVEELEEENLKKAPYEDTLFLDNIIKKEKASDYVNYLQKPKYALTRLKEALEEGSDIQKINASINVLDLYTTNLQNKYQDKTEAFTDSYKEILLTNYEAKIFGNLLYDSNYYSQFVPTNDSQHSINNINAQKQKLLNKVNKTILLIIQQD